MNKEILEFKNSNIAWIGQIPKHWEIKKLKYVLNERKENNKPIKTDFILSLTNEKGVIPYSEKGAQGNISKDDLSGYKIAYPNDIVLNSMNVVIGSVGLSKYYGAISPVYYALYEKQGSNIKFYNYIFQTSIFQNSLKGLGNGILEIRMRIPMSNLNNVYLPVPPLAEQERIAGFLDDKCASIDSSIENLEQKTKSLAEYKKALITQCVTKGLNPKILEFKDSGIPWIGQIPKHWEISKIKYYFNFSSGLNITKENLIESGIPVISYGQIHSKENTGTFIKDSFFRFISQDYLKNKKSLVNKGNFIFADTSEDLDGAGNSVFVDLDLTMFAGYHTIILKNKCNFEFSKFLSYLFQTDLWRSQIRLAVSGVKVFSITKKILANCEILVPPLTEQEKIAGFLDKKCEKIDNLSANYKEQIKTLKEYKKALIYECVTGKKQI